MSASHSLEDTTTTLGVTLEDLRAIAKARAESVVDLAEHASGLVTDNVDVAPSRAEEAIEALRAAETALLAALKPTG